MAEKSLKRPSPFWMLALLAAVSMPAAQEEREKPLPNKPGKPIREAATWPKLSAKDAGRTKGLLKLLRSKNEDAASRAEQQLIALGPAVAPLAIAKLTDFKINNNDALRRILNTTTTKIHAPLIAEHVLSRTIATRLWTLRRMSGWHLEKMAPLFRRQLTHKDPEVAFHAAVALASAGEITALDKVFGRCLDNWRNLRDWVAPALQGCRGEPASMAMLEHIDKGSSRETLTALHILRSVGEKETAHRIKHLLDSEDHNLKKAAINTLRVIIDNQPPLEKLSVFQAINTAREWKQRLR